MRKRALLICCLTVLAVLTIFGYVQPEQAVDAAMEPVSLDPSAKPAKYLSEYNFFKDAAKQIPNEGVVPYDLNSPLFSDYSTKYRFIYVPPGTQVKYDETEFFDFPVGSAILKTFSFMNDLRDPSKGERIIETRVLLKKDDGEWVGLPYRWKDDMSDAYLAVVGGRATVEWTHLDGEVRMIKYIIPNMNQCKQCHENDKVIQPIGPKARHLNKDFAYDGSVENQLKHWKNAGLLTGLPKDEASIPQNAVWDNPETGTLNERARAYLDINCAHCHNPKGPAYTSGLDLSIHQESAVRVGVMKPPVAAGRGAGGLDYSIVPGDPDKSILVYRIESLDPGAMMPQLPRQVVHDEGVALIREWITKMPTDS